MAKRPKRWSMWKIAVAIALCAVVSPLLFWLSALTETDLGHQTTTPFSRAPALTLASLLMMLGIAVGMLGVLGVIWLLLRFRDSRIPAWKKRIKKERY